MPLGVVKKCENRVDEMCTILHHIHQYIPSKTTTLNLLLPSGDVKNINSELFHRVLLGGDQLTVARARSACAARSDHGSSGQRLCGLLPVFEDWHAKMCYLKVCGI